MTNHRILKLTLEQRNCWCLVETIITNKSSHSLILQRIMSLKNPQLAQRDKSWLKHILPNGEPHRIISLRQSSFTIISDLTHLKIIEDKVAPKKYWSKLKRDIVRKGLILKLKYWYHPLKSEIHLEILLESYH